MQYVKLNNGVQVPMVGYGTFLIDKNQATACTLAALKAGYRHIDTAQGYCNESEIGDAIVASGIPRSEIFITTKFFPVPNNLNFGYVEYVVEQQLQKLKTKYIDLYLIHWPKMKNDNARLWRSFEKLYEKKWLRSIGVSNFWRHHLEDLLTSAKIKPQMNQIHISPHYYPIKMIEYCQQAGIPLTAYSFFKAKELDNEIIKEIALAKKATPAQVIIRWGLQLGFCMIPKSVTPSRIIENMNVFHFSLTSEEVKRITKITYGKGQAWNPEALNHGGITW